MRVTIFNRAAYELELSALLAHGVSTFDHMVSCMQES
jgi:hypothetical protein